MNSQVVAAVIAASVSVFTLIGTLAAQYFGRRATSRQLDRTFSVCGYLRMPYEPDPGGEAAPADRAAYRAMVFDGGDFRGTRFTGGTISFSDARFTAGTVSFYGAEFSGGFVSFGGPSSPAARSASTGPVPDELTITVPDVA